MLISSGVVKGRCPICGAAHGACGGPTNVVGVDERMVSASMGGKMVQIEIGPGRSIQMTEEEAIRQGLRPKPTPNPAKALPPAPNKKRKPDQNKGTMTPVLGIGD